MTTLWRAFPVPVEHARWVYFGPDGAVLGQAPIGDWSESVWRQEAPGGPWVRTDTPVAKPVPALLMRPHASPRSPFATRDEIGMSPRISHPSKE
jgi:hypothetical protein